VRGANKKQGSRGHGKPLKICCGANKSREATDSHIPGFLLCITLFKSRAVTPTPPPSPLPMVDQHTQKLYLMIPCAWEVVKSCVHLFQENLHPPFYPPVRRASCAPGRIPLTCWKVQVKETMVKFEERLWSIIRNFVTLGRDMPAMLVNAVRIVELQEMVDAKLEASAHRSPPPPPPPTNTSPGPLPPSSSSQACNLCDCGKRRKVACF